MNHKPNRFNDILTNIVTGVTITAWGTAVRGCGHFLGDNHAAIPWL